MNELTNEQFEQLVDLADRYLQGEMSVDELALLESMLLADASFAKAFNQVTRQAGVMRMVFSEQQSFAKRIGEADADEYLAMLRSLQPREQIQPVQVVVESPSKSNLPMWIGVGGAVAAVLALLVTLAVVLPTRSTQPSQTPVVNTPEKVYPSAINPSVIASLTAEQDAQWVEVELTPGDELPLNKRLTLTQGLAQITTGKGAVAILKAPAQIEVLGDNAIRLNAGQLVGICEVASSKGFLVRTPHMDITDVGTRFGVDTKQADRTEVYVIEGEVEVARDATHDGNPVRRLLAQGQGVAANVNQGSLETIEVDPERFASITPRKIELRGGGRGLAMGEIDRHWRVVAADGKPLDQAAYLVAGNAPGGHGHVVINDPAVSQWLRGDHIQFNRSGKQATFTCRTTFDLPVDLDADNAALVIQFLADERVAAIRLNGQSFKPPANSWDNDEIESLFSTRISQGLRAGSNTLELDVVDLVRGNSTQWSLHVRWHLEERIGASP